MFDFGFIVYLVFVGKVNKFIYSGEINLKDIVIIIVLVYIVGFEFLEFENLVKLLIEDFDNIGVVNFLDFWWNFVSFYENNL